MAKEDGPARQGSGKCRDREFRSSMAPLKSSTWFPRIESTGCRRKNCLIRDWIAVRGQFRKGLVCFEMTLDSILTVKETLQVFLCFQMKHINKVAL